MSSPSETSIWFQEADTMLEPSLMSTGICPMSVFDKFGWDADELLGTVGLKCEPEDEALIGNDDIVFGGSLDPIFPDLIEDTIKTETHSDFDCTKLLAPSSTPTTLSTTAAANIDHSKSFSTDVRIVMASCNTVTSSAATKTNLSPIIRFPVKRSASTSIGSATGSRIKAVKAVVVLPDQSKRIVCNVVRSSNKGPIVIQKPVNRSWLNVRGSIRSEPSKLPIKVNVISSKENSVQVKNLVSRTELPFCIKQEPASDSISCSNVSITGALLNNTISENDEIRPETPQSLVGSDEEFHPFSSPLKDYLQDDYTKSFLSDDDNLCSDSYKLVPLAEVTGQVQPVIPDIFKYTPDSSPINNEESLLDSLYPKLNDRHNRFYNKAAANVDHDYGFTCRTPKSSSSVASIFNVDSLGIQTPSASEPPTDSDDDDEDEEDNLLSDVNLLNKDFDCSELDREQSEYFEDLQHQLKLAELVCQANENSHQSSQLTAVKERKQAGRKIKTKAAIRDNNVKRKKTGGGGRIFSPTERHLHNTNEQVRRIEMRQSFEELRRLIPNLIEKSRAPKVSILQEAKAYCDELLHSDMKLQAQIAALKCQQERLRCSLSWLRRHAAASRHG